MSSSRRSSIVHLSPSAAFYLRASIALGHGHSIPCGKMVPVEGSKSLGGYRSVRVSNWPALGTGSDYILGVEEVHFLHKYYGATHNLGRVAVSGLEGWVESDQGGVVQYEHKTGTGRLRLWANSSSHGFEVRRGPSSEESVGQVVCSAWYNASLERWVADKIDILECKARPDRFCNLLDIIYQTYSSDAKAVGKACIQDEGLLELTYLGEILAFERDQAIKSRLLYLSEV